MINLTKASSAWGNEDFEDVLKREIVGLDARLLPLQAGLSQTSYVSDSEINVVVLGVNDVAASIQVKAGVFYGGIIAGSCCADDPTPVDEQTEYCEILFDIDKETGAATATLLPDPESQ